jgi:hypothetical protein
MDYLQAVNLLSRPRFFSAPADGSSNGVGGGGASPGGAGAKTFLADHLPRLLASGT